MKYVKYNLYAKKLSVSQDFESVLSLFLSIPNAHIHGTDNYILLFSGTWP
jgi:hypothetical protein